MKNSLIQTDRFILTKDEHLAIKKEILHYEEPRAAAIEALKIIQNSRGWVADGAIHEIAKVLGISASDVEGVATFYSQIFREPVGRHIIRICDSMTCYIGNYEQLLSSIQNKLDIKLGGTTADNRFTLLPVCCLGNCDKAPVLMVNGDTFGGSQLLDIDAVLEDYP